MCGIDLVLAASPEGRPSLSAAQDRFISESIKAIQPRGPDATGRLEVLVHPPPASGPGLPRTELLALLMRHCDWGSLGG